MSEESGSALLPTRATGHVSASRNATPVVSEVLRGSGRPHDEATRDYMEPRHGHDFSRVRVHAEVRAAAPVLRSGPMLARQPSGEGQQPTGEVAPPPSAQAEPTQAGGAKGGSKVEAVESNKKSYVLYETKVRFDGSSAWLANNPGNMDYTENTKKWGCYDGVKLHWGQHNFAVFPDEGTGLAAVQSFLRMFQGERDITLMMNLFAPAGDSNDPDSYAARVAKKMQVPVTTLVKTMSDEQLAIFADAIQEVEGWKVGTEVPRGDSSLPEDIRKR